MSSSPLYLGIDLGTGGVRALVVSAAGDVVAQSSVPYAKADRQLPVGHHEQNAHQWWQVTQQAIAAVVALLREKAIAVEAITALAVDGTSGTVVGVDENGQPMGPGLMYNDGRASEEARELGQIAAKSGPSPAGQIAASYAIAKIRWMQKHELARFKGVRWFVHQADYITSKLTGQWGITDYSNALKTGFDLVAGDWPQWMQGYPEIRRRLPCVVAPGDVLGTVSPIMASQLGLPAKLRIIAGATDGTAGFLASGAHAAGQINTTLGTTLVFKQLATAPIIDPRGLIYCHKLPGGRWLPGAASNTGCEWMAVQYPVADFAAMDRQAMAHFPCETLAYPLARQGERFPFQAPQAMGFCESSGGDDSLAYAAQLQGVALIERMSYDALDQACGVASLNDRAPIFATGGGARSDIWAQLRADVTGRVYHRPASPESALGAAVLAALPDHADLASAVRAMVRIERVFVPSDSLGTRYDAIYERFKRVMSERFAME